MRREWVWMQWLRPVVAPPACAPEPERAPDLSSTIDQAVQSAQAALEARLNEMNATLNTLAGTTNALLENMHTPENAHAPERARAHSSEEERAPVQEEERAPIFDQHPDDQEVCIGVPTLTHIQATRTGTAVQLNERDEALEPTEGPPTATAILTAFLRLGAQATDTDVAHETGYSRTTVARWRKRFLSQGQLPVSSTSAQLSETAREPDLISR